MRSGPPSICLYLRVVHQDALLADYATEVMWNSYFSSLMYSWIFWRLDRARLSWEMRDSFRSLSLISCMDVHQVVLCKSAWQISDHISDQKGYELVVQTTNVCADWLASVFLMCNGSFKVINGSCSLRAVVWSMKLAAEPESIMAARTNLLSECMIWTHRRNGDKLTFAHHKELRWGASPFGAAREVTGSLCYTLGNCMFGAPTGKAQAILPSHFFQGIFGHLSEALLEYN